MVFGSQIMLEVIYSGPMVLGSLGGAWFLWMVNTGAAARKMSVWKLPAVAAMGALISGGVVSVEG